MKKRRRTNESQYECILEISKKYGIDKLGLMTNQAWNEDPKHFLFTLARYKFVAKMLSGNEEVLEIGCADGKNLNQYQQSLPLNLQN